MPGVDGITATREIRRRPAGWQSYICGLSAHAEASFQQECLTAGMDRYLTKPIEFDKLRHLLEDVSAKLTGR